MAQEETGAAAGSRGDARRRPGSAETAWDPEQWWSFGEAADRAGVTHRTLQGWAERGEVMVRMAWREGTEFRLVRAGDVARLAPAAAASEDASASLEDRALFTGPRRSALGAGAPPSPQRPEGARPARYDDDRDAFRRTAELEIERLKGELEELRRRGDAGAARGGASPAPMDLWSIHGERGVAPGPRVWAFGPRWLVVFVGGLALGLTAGTIWERGGAADGRRAGEIPGDVPIAATQLASAGATAATRGAAPAEASSSSTAVDPGGSSLAIGAAPVVDALADALAGPAAGPAAGPSGDTGEGAGAGRPHVVSAAAGAESGAERVVSASMVGSPGAGPGTGPGAGPGTSSERDGAAPMEAPREVARGPEARLPLGLDECLERGRGTSVTSLDGATTCAFGTGRLATPRARLVLGGCWGERAPGGAGVLATDRVQGVACCKHHAAVQRLKRVATVPRALTVASEEADQAIRDGLVPPMLELRADRSALLLARELTGGWRASGFDGPAQDRVHQWRFASREQDEPGAAEGSNRADGADGNEDGAKDGAKDGIGARLELLSWLQRGEDGGFAAYRLVLELGGSTSEDRAVEFEWLD